MKKIIQNNILYTRRGLSTSHRPAVTTYFVPYNLSVIQRAFLIPYFGIGAISDPRRGDLVAGLGDATSEWHLKRMKNQLMTTSSGRKLMLEKPLITNESIRLLSSSYREGSLGEKYTEFMKDHDFDADGRAVVRFIPCSELAYVMCRYRQVHDFWHVLCDLPPTVLGEVALKWFEFKATGLPVCLFSGLLGPLKLTSEERKYLITEYLPWVMRSKCHCDEILAFRYEDTLHRSVEEIRDLLRIEKAPRYIK